MDTNSIDNAYGECRCCLAKGKHRDIMREYFFNGTRELYYEIFKECLNLCLSQRPELTTLICSNCIMRLRDAYSFRMMVCGTERTLINIINKNTPTEFVDVIEEPNLEMDIKYEAVEVKMEDVEQTLADDCDFPLAEYNDDHDEYDEENDDKEGNNRPAEPLELVEGEAEFLARHRTLKPLPTRESLYSLCPHYVRQLSMLEHVVVTASMVTVLQGPEVERFSYNNTYLSEKAAHITNITILLQLSNMTPFKSKGRSGFPCFYCRSTYEDFNKLREHNLEHKTSELSKVLKRYSSEVLVVYADVKDLKCNICGQDVPSLPELKNHLSSIHSKVLVNEVNDRVIPFVIEQKGYTCQICACNFVTFGAMERHMNGHYRNYVCKDCGSGFITKYRLKIHAKAMHVDGAFPCEVCGKMFSTQQKYKNHVNTVHKMLKRFKCPKCPERFAEYFRRQKHMVEIHGLAPLRYSCNVCDRSFNRRYTLSRHLKRDHLEERDYECEVCNYKCFTKNELKVHMVKHGGERIFECSVCKKSYARKKTLKEHMRIHNNDRRFVCPVCGQAFVQKCSLKGHLKTHHLEYNLQT